MKNKIYFLLFFIIFLISGLTVSYAYEPTKYGDTYLVEFGSEIKFTGDISEITSKNTDTSNDTAIAVSKEDDKNTLAVRSVGAFEVTVTDATTNKSTTLKFFSWNAYLKGHCEMWVYSDEARGDESKKGIMTSRSYLAVDPKGNETFQINEYLFAEDGMYYNLNQENPEIDELKGQYMKNYYNTEKNKSNSPCYDFSFEKSDELYEIDLSNSNPSDDDPSGDNTTGDNPSDDNTAGDDNTTGDNPADDNTTGNDNTTGDNPSDDNTAGDGNTTGGSTIMNITKDTSVKIDEDNALPALDANQINYVIENWAKVKYSKKSYKNNAKVDALTTEIFTEDTVDKIVEYQDSTNVSAVFMLAVADRATDLGLNDGVTDKNNVAGWKPKQGHNLFNLKVKGNASHIDGKNGERYASFNTYGECFQAFTEKINTEYFEKQQTTIGKISKQYATDPSNWRAKVIQYASAILTHLQNYQN